MIYFSDNEILTYKITTEKDDTCNGIVLFCRYFIRRLILVFVFYIREIKYILTVCHHTFVVLF